MSLGIQVAFPSNVSAGAATTAPGRLSSGGTGAETFLSTYASSLSNSGLEAARSSENSVTKGKTSAKAAAGVGGLTANPKTAPKADALMANAATGAAPVTVPAAPQVLSSMPAPVTLPDFAPALAATQDLQLARGWTCGDCDCGNPDFNVSEFDYPESDRAGFDGLGDGLDGE